MNRREFLVRSSSAVSLGCLATHCSLFAQTASPQKAPPTADVAFVPLRRNVGLFTGKGGTIGWLSSADALAVVDTQFSDTAAKFLAGLPGRADRMIDVVINTHHHADHTGGNGVLKPVAKTIVAHAHVPALQRAAMRAGSTEPVVADKLFADTWRQEVGDEVLSGKHFGPGHTKGDIVVSFEKANVVHMGDLAFNRRYPVIDRPGGASIKGWIGILETVLKDYPADAIYIFGHSNPKFSVSNPRTELVVFRDYLSAMLEHVQKEIAAGKTKDQVTALENFPNFPDFHEKMPNRLGSNLGVAYDELTAKG